MKDTYQKPCATWAEQLAAASQKDLTGVERAMLDEHVASCPACAAVRSAYRQMDSDLMTMPPIEPHMIYADQLPVRENILRSSVRGESQKPTSRSVERHGKTSTLKAKQARITEDFQEKVPTSRRVGFQRMLTTLSAVLVVCGIIASSMLLFSRHLGVGPGTGNHKTVTPTQATSGERPTSPVVPGLYAALANGTVYALQPDTGAILWRQQLNLGGQGVIGGPQAAHGVVYVGSFNGSLYALRELDGALLWQHALGATPAFPIAGDDPQVIYVGAGTTLYALHASDGSELWHRTSDSTTYGTYNIPLIVTGGRVFGYDGGGLFALSAGDGHALWQGKHFNGVALVVAGDKMFATVGTGEQIEVSHTSDGQFLHMLSVTGNLGFDQGRLYVANQESQKLFILRPEDESIITQVQMACPVQSSPNPLVVQNGLVYTYSWGRSLQQAWVCAMNAGDGKQVWRWTQTHRIAYIASLVSASNHLYFLYTDSDFAKVELYALKTSDGAQLWKYAFPSNFAYGGYFAIEGK